LFPYLTSRPSGNILAEVYRNFAKIRIGG